MRDQLGFTWRELLIVLSIMVLWVAVPEWYAPDETVKICQSIQIGGTLQEIENNKLFSDGIHFRCGFDAQAGSGALVKMVGGWFPFGRDFCVVTVEHGIVVGQHAVFGDIDYDCDSCKKDMRRIAEIEPSCQH